ncbi:glycosyltransferase [Pelagibacterales bacterium]|nr:glycosyltransferase [Pelagibacterales bacterium]
MSLVNNEIEEIKSKVVVLLAAYNGMRFIEEQVSSILNQTGVEVKIFISVDKSTDETYQWCKSIEDNNKTITVLPYGEKFGGAAKNFFRLIKDVNFNDYSFVALSDQDDIWEPQKLYRAVSCINNKRYDAFSSDVTAFWKNGKKVYIKKSWPQKKYDYLFESAGPGCTYVLKAKALNSFKIFLLSNWNLINKISLHDWMIYAYFRKNRFNWYIDNFPLIQYRQHENNEFGSNSGLKAYLKRFLLVKNNWYRKEVTKINELLKLRISLNFWFRFKNFWELRRRPRDVLILLIISISGLY